MKTIISVVIGLLLIPSVSFAAFDHNLYYGLQGNSEVLALQEFLADQGVYTGPITGNFFALTLAGVKAFQARKNITPVSGYFGILSRGVANQMLAPVAPEEETGTPTVPVPTPPAPVYNAPPPVTPTVLSGVMDTAPRFAGFSIVHGNLVIAADKLLNIGQTTFTNGVTLNEVLTDGRSNSVANKLIGTQRFSPAIPIYDYEATLNIPEGVTSFDVTVKDTTGNQATMSVTK